MEEGGREKEKGCKKVWKSEEIKGERRCGRGSLKERERKSGWVCKGFERVGKSEEGKNGCKRV